MSDNSSPAVGAPVNGESGMGTALSGPSSDTKPTPVTSNGNEVNGQGSGGGKGDYEESPGDVGNADNKHEEAPTPAQQSPAEGNNNPQNNSQQVRQLQMQQQQNYAGGQPAPDPEQFRKLFIGGLSSSTTDESLRAFYSNFGELTDCVVMRDAQTKKSRGFGFVSFSSKAEVDAAMAARPHEIDGKVVDPKRAVPRDTSNKSESNISTKRLYVSGVRDEHTEEQMDAYFSAFGKVIKAEIIQDKSTGKARGFGFITFEDHDSVDQCVLMKSHMIGPYRCDVKKALSKEDMARAQQLDRDRQERGARSRGGIGPRGGGGGGYGGAGGMGGGGRGGGWSGYGAGGNSYDGGYGGGGYGGAGGSGGRRGGYGGNGGRGDQGGYADAWNSPQPLGSWSGGPPQQPQQQWGGDGGYGATGGGYGGGGQSSYSQPHGGGSGTGGYGGGAPSYGGYSSANAIPQGGGGGGMPWSAPGQAANWGPPSQQSTWYSDAPGSGWGSSGAGGAGGGTGGGGWNAGGHPGAGGSQRY